MTLTAEKATTYYKNTFQVTSLQDIVS